MFASPLIRFNGSDDSRGGFNDDHKISEGSGRSASNQSPPESPRCADEHATANVHGARVHCLDNRRLDLAGTLLDRIDGLPFPICAHALLLGHARRAWRRHLPASLLGFHCADIFCVGLPAEVAVDFQMTLAAKVKRSTIGRHLMYAVCMPQREMQRQAVRPGRS